MKGAAKATMIDGRNALVTASTDIPSAAAKTARRNRNFMSKLSASAPTSHCSQLSGSPSIIWPWPSMVMPLEL